jgi:HEAT repeat protein
VFEWDRQPAYVFPHRSILEFLAGAELAEKLKSNRDGEWWDLVDRMAWDPGWVGVLLFAAGQLGERVNDLARRLLDGEDDIFCHRLALAAMCLAEAPATVRKQGLLDSITKEVWNTCYAHSGAFRGWFLDKLDHLSKAWAAAARLNGRVRNRSLVEELKDRIRQGDLGPIQLAARLGPVARQGNLIPALLTALKSKDSWVQLFSADSLGRLPDAAAAYPEVIPALLAALKHEDRTVCVAARNALGQLGDAAAAHPEVIPALLAALTDPDWQVRWDAAAILGELARAAAGHPEVIPALLAALRDQDKHVREAAAETLGKLGEAAAAHREVIPALVATLKHRERRVRRAAAEALAKLGEAAASHPEVIPELLAALKDEDRWVRSAAAQALGKLGEAAAAHPEVIPALLAALTDPDWQVRGAAAEALGELARGAAAHREVIPALLAALNDRDLLVRHYAAEALGMLAATAASQGDVLAAMYQIYRTDSDLAERVLALWDRQGLRIFLRRRGFSVCTLTELAQRSRT